MSTQWIQFGGDSSGHPPHSKGATQNVGSFARVRRVSPPLTPPPLTPASNFAPFSDSSGALEYGSDNSNSLGR